MNSLSIYISTTVQPVPAPAPIKLDDINNNKEGGNNQKLKLFNLGKAISGAPNISGTIQFNLDSTFQY